MFDNFIIFLNSNSGVIQFLSLVLWGVYVFFTIKTFLQIKEQTELQSNALLHMECIDSSYNSNENPLNKTTNEVAKEYSRWRKVIENNIPDAISEDRKLIFLLKNKGKSDIISWKINIEAKIIPRDKLSQLNIHGKEMNWSIESEKAQDIIGINEEILIHIMDVGNIPELSLTWKIEYKDSRRKLYNDFYGDSKFFDINALT